jgi:hypothetical protein
MKKTGMELVLTLQLALEYMDDIKLTGLPKRYGNMFKNAIEKDLSIAYDRGFSIDQQIMINAMNKKESIISIIAGLSEPDCMLFTQFAEHFIENIEEARKGNQIYLNKIL